MSCASGVEGDRKARVAAIVVAAAILLLAAGAAPGAVPTPDPPARLTDGAPIERRLAGTARHTYVIALRSGDFVELRVDQLGLDAVLTLSSPDARELARVNQISGGVGSERAYLLAGIAGDYFVEVRAADTEAREGAYAIGIRELRSAVNTDRLRIEAQRLYQDAEAIRTAGNRDSARQSVPIFEEALRRWREAGDRWQEAQTLSTLAQAWTQAAEYRKSVELYPEAIEMWRSVADKRGEALGLHNAGATYGILGEHQTAIEHLNRALALRRASGDRAGEAQTLSMIGDQYAVLGDPRASLDVQNQALPLRRAAGDRRGEACALRNIGQAWTDLGDPRKALPYLENSLAIFRAVGDRDGEPTALAAIADAAAALGDISRALDLYSEAIALSHATGNRRFEAGARSERAELLRVAGRTAEASEQLIDAVAVQGELRDARAEATTLVRLARTERDAGRLEEARRRIETALDRIETLRSTVLGPDLKASSLSSKQNAFELHVDILMALDRKNPSAGYAARALQANERARARSLLETLGEAHADVDESLAPDSSKRHRSLQRELNGRAASLSRVLAGKHTEQEAAQADAALKSALADYEAFEAELRSSHPRYAALVAARPLDAPAIQKRVLDPETVLLEFALGRNRSYVWAVTPSSLAVYELPARAQIEAAVRRCHEALANSHRVGRRADTRLAVEALSRMLLQPVAREIAGKRILIVADGALQVIPFGTLTEPSGSARGEPLIAGHEIVAVPSASVIDSLRQPQVRPSADRSVAVFADPVFQAADARVSAPSARGSGGPQGPPLRLLGHTPGLGAKSGGGRAGVLRSAEDLDIGGLARLRFTRQEARAITRLAGQDSSLAALDFDASRETATDPAISRYRIVHFATHAFADSEHPERSGIVLSLVGPNGEPTDGFLRLHDIYNLKLGADLVVLSACQVALGKEVRGEGLAGLTSGFLYAGALSVVASLWNVRDEGTSEFMTRFYRAMLREGLTPTAALRRAQLSMWKDPAWSAPFYWAGFTIQGDWRPAPPSR